MDWESIADWFGAVGTIAMVIITLQKLREPLLFSVYELTQSRQHIWLIK